MITTAPLLQFTPGLRKLSSHALEKLPLTDVAGVEVESATRDQYEGVSNSFLEKSALSTAKVVFGKLSEQDFSKLSKEFGGRSKVPYQVERSYEATDFLPPALQALHGRDLELPEAKVLPGSKDWEFILPLDEDKRVDLTANCHGTAWEAMQAYQDVGQLEIYFGDAVRMDGQLEDESLFEKLGQLEASRAGELSKQNFQPGDVVAFYNPGGFSVSNLLHTAVYAGGGLFFEKPDTENQESGDAPYRLSTAEMVQRPIEAFLEGPAEVRMYRAKRALPEPEVAFGSTDLEQVKQWETAHGHVLGGPLLTQLELSIGGGIRGEYLTSLANVAVVAGADGRGEPAPKFARAG